VPDDRDRTFEKALARHLRSGAQGPDASNRECPATEILAAYHERSLAPEQMNSFKEHIAGCARCQEILAQLEATDDIMVEALDELPESQKVLSMPAHVPEDAALPEEITTTAPSGVPSRAARVAQSRLRRQALRGANWRWLAPAGAIAASLLVWVALHESRPTSFEMAKNIPVAAPSQNSPAKQKSDVEEPASRVPETRSNARADAGDRVRSKIAAAAPGPALKKEQASVEQKTPSPQPPGAAQAPAGVTAGAIGGVVSGNVNPPNLTAENRIELDEKQPAALPPAPSAPATEKDPYAASVESASASKAAAAPKSRAVAGTGGRQAPQEQDNLQVTASQLRETTALRLAKARGTVTVAAPASEVQWKIGPAGLIERSVDRGATRVIQLSGVVTDLTAGSAPSEQVCWIVGRAGTILRTTDGGEQWMKVSSPTGDDLASVFAVDAEQAAVTSASTKKSYKTTDGGQTWALVHPQ
jgi:Putative zinc-finger